MSKTKKSSRSLSSKVKKFSRAGLAVLSSIPTPGWGSASKKALAVSVSRSKVKKTSTKNKNQTNKKTSKKLSSLKNLLKRLSQKSRYGRMYTNARKLSSQRDKLNKQEKLKLAMLITVDALATGRSKKKQEEKNPITKSLESIGGIGADFWKAAEERDKKKFDSVSDFINYASLGALGGAKSAYDAGAERSKKMFDSPYGFGNWLTVGSFDLVDGALNPKDPLSREHWLNSIGLAGTVVGGGATSQALKGKGKSTSGTGSGVTKEKKSENTQEVSGSKGMGKGVEINNPVLDSVRTGSALKLDAQHAFNNIIDNYASSAQKFKLVGGDKVTRELYQIEGSLNGKQGVFEWIIDPDPLKGVTHRRFIEGVGVTGKPNAVPKR